MHRVHKVNYLTLLRVLYNLRCTTADAFHLAGKPLPELPTWGTKANILNIYSLNDPEILGLCFRVEVENFLVILDKHYNFIEHCLREDNTIIRAGAAFIKVPVHN
ncbi:hypothetical protein C8R45DRAFT_941646 [Mycena sanguinolenta]|nr:hypothetical protein C8R45DRAFT_941646 [Mycena sanguinolenta]